ncbi:MAG: type II toxin-antitoxin system PemK/MazF family toxin [Saprospiraceae bacterium]|nr:type II toxin-antitoxin system PemK/MazF family toxin [Saprospiraceae bacterium]
MKQGEIWSTDLNPTQGNEQAGQSPILIISGDAMNLFTSLVIACPLTSIIKNLEGCVVINKSKENNLNSSSEILVFQVRSISKSKLIKRLGSVSPGIVKVVHEQLYHFLQF